MNAIEIAGLRKQYKSRVAVDDLTLTVGQGECIALLGQNGAGKTTTIKMLCCLLQPTGGTARVAGFDIGDEPNSVKQRINVSPQETAIAPNLSVRENLEFTARLYGFDKAAARKKATDMLDDFAFAERANDRAKQLSGGLKRRLSIAMALISDPEILFLDEPTLGLDVRARRALWKQIEALKGKITVVLTTHYLEEAEALCDRIAILHEGRLQVYGTVQDILQTGNYATFEDAFLDLTETEAAL